MYEGLAEGILRFKLKSRSPRSTGTGRLSLLQADYQNSTWKQQKGLESGYSWETPEGMASSPARIQMHHSI